MHTRWQALFNLGVQAYMVHHMSEIGVARFYLLHHTQNLLSLAKNASRLLLMRSSLMPLQQAAALGIMQVCLPWVICLAVKFSVTYEFFVVIVVCGVLV